MKIAIVGYSGSGKSTLARELGEKLECPVQHLDRVHWLPGWTWRPAKEEQALAKKFLDENDRWVIDGNYRNLSYDRRMAEADQIVFLAFGRWRCLARALDRYWKNRGKSRESMAEGCPEKMDREFIWWILWQGRSPRKQAEYAQLAAQYPEKVSILRNPAQLERWKQHRAWERQEEG